MKKKLFAKGLFTKAYLTEAGRVLLHTIDPIKNAIGEQLFLPTHRMIPQAEKIDSFFNGVNDVFVLDMEYMPRPSSIKQNVSARQWRFYNLLRDVATKIVYGFYPTDYDRTAAIYKQFEGLPYEFRSEREILIETLDGIKNYVDNVGFEISPRNVTVKGGKLVLLDCFFDPKTLRDTRNGHIKI